MVLMLGNEETSDIRIFIRTLLKIFPFKK